MNRVLHLWRPTTFTDGYIHFVNENFDNQNHEFLVYGPKMMDMPYLKYDNVNYQRYIRLYLLQERNRKKILSFDKIIIHGVFDADIIDKWYKDKELCAKTYLYLWGGDFYPENHQNDSFKEMMKRRMLFKNVAGIINILEVENNIVKKLYHPKGKLYHAVYWDDEVITYTGVNHQEKLENHSVLNIQVGNSASETNHHIKILEALEPYKSEAIKIYVPLSYGDLNYAKQVEEYGKAHFGDKFIPVTKMMDKQAYYDWMRKMDVAIFDVERQQALANINAHLLYGHIVYLNKKSVPNYFYKYTVGCKVRHTQQIGEYDFKKFRYMKEADREQNMKCLSDFLSKSSCINQWEQIFSADNYPE